MYKELIFKILVFTFLANSLNAQVIANFMSNKVSGCVPLLVNFNNQSLNQDSLSYQWFFGNGNTSTLVNPQAAYILPGKYTVTLIAFNDSLRDTLTMVNYITVYPKPTVDFATIGANQGCVPLSISFDNKSTSSVGINTSIWTLGDGNMSFENEPQHLYSESGFYQISLKVSDNNGCENSTFKNNYISVVERPHLNFTVTDTFFCDTPATVYFINNSISQFETSYLWNFGDGSTSGDISPSHIYENTGNYNVNLIGTNQYSCSDTLVREEIFSIANIESRFEIVKDTFCVNEEIFFNDLSINAGTYLWDFGDGSTSELNNPSHFYETDGDYIVTLTVRNTNNCIDEFIDTLNIAKIKANFTTDVNYACTESLEVHFTDLSENASFWEWHLGNHNNLFEQNPVSIYSLELGNRIEFDDTLIVKNIFGCSDTIVKEKNIIISVPRAYCTPNNSMSYSSQVEGCFPVIVNFTNESIYDSEFDSISSIFWDFGDSTYSYLNNVSHTFGEVGEYHASLLITTELGCSNQYNVDVSVGSEQIANFEVQGITEMCANYAFNFVNTSSDLDLINEYHWIFSDGTFSTAKDVNHFFVNSVGSFSTSLAVAYNGCWSDTYLEQDIVYTEGALCSFEVIQNCENSYSVTFEGNIIDATHWYWQFGDNDVDYTNQETVTHTYAQSGDYTVILTAINENNDCAYVYEKLIYVRKPQAIFTLSETIGCPGLEVSFNPFNSKDAAYNYFSNNQPKKYQWYFPENNETMYSNLEIEHTFNQKGKTAISLIVSDIHGCIDTMTRYVKIYKPEASFTADTNSGCVPFTAHFINQTNSDTIYRSVWNFEGNGNSNNNNPVHTFTGRKKYDVSLSVVDTLGCSDLLVIEDFIEAKKPNPQISIYPQNSCLGDSILFKDLNDIGLNYNWNFGDSTHSIENEVSHLYQNSGNYDVNLKVSYDGGCDTTISLSDYIRIQDYPVAEFITDTTYSDCYPFLVKFSSLSIAGSPLTYEWNFGDNTLSTIESPTHSYITPGDFNLSLKISTAFGCADSIIKPAYIHVGGPYAEISKPTVICKGVENEFSLKNEMNIYDFKWDMGDGTIKYGDTIFHTYNMFGTIYPSLILYSDSLNTCNITLIDSIYINLIVADFTIETSGICETYPIEFTNISVGTDQYFWTINNQEFTEISPVYFFDNSGIYPIKLITLGSDGCKDSISKNIIIHSLPTIIASHDTLICRGDELQLQASGGVEYLWFSSIDTITENYPIVSPDSTITYSVNGTDSKGCSNIDSIKVSVQQIPVLHVSNDTTLIIGDLAPLIANSDQEGTFVWIPETYLSCVNCNNPTSKPMESTVYTVSIEDVNNCFVISKEIAVDVRKEYTVDLPTVFTPNKDGVNEFITPRGWGLKNILEYNIYNKWGELVYSYDELLDKGWNGTYKGKEQESDTYVYFIKIETYENEILSKKGTFNLIR